MRRSRITPVSLREIYQLPGEYSAKFIIDQSISTELDETSVKILNSDGVPMRFTTKRWGTKLTVTFTVDDTTPDGVSIIDIVLAGKNQTIRERYDFWVIK